MTLREARVTRTISAIVAVLLAATSLSGSAAGACISCEYTPEVVGTPSKSKGTTPQAKEYPRAKERSHKVVKARRPTERNVVKRAPAAEPAAKEVETAKSAGTETKEENGKPANSSATSALIEAQTRKDSSTGVTTPAATPGDVPAQSETALSTAIVAAPQAPADAPKVEVQKEQEAKVEQATAQTKVEDAKAAAPEPQEAKPDNKTDCKKFFPAVELTLVVPCE
jgi:hypothetical protein